MIPTLKILFIVGCFVFIAGPAVSFAPFRVSFERPIYAIGWVLIISGAILIHYHGYKTGSDHTLDLVNEVIDKKIEEAKK